jgi:hypothetical protein
MDEHRVIQERLAAFEVDGSYTRLFGLIQDPLDLFYRQNTLLIWATPHEAMLTFVNALVRQKDVQA